MCHMTGNNIEQLPSLLADMCSESMGLLRLEVPESLGGRGGLF